MRIDGTQMNKQRRGSGTSGPRFFCLKCRKCSFISHRTLAQIAFLSALKYREKSSPTRCETLIRTYAIYTEKACKSL
jgi:hypothetical protein